MKAARRLFALGLDGFVLAAAMASLAAASPIVGNYESGKLGARSSTAASPKA
jgi:hypothetical protein